MKLNEQINLKNKLQFYQKKSIHLIKTATAVKAKFYYQPWNTHKLRQRWVTNYGGSLKYFIWSQNHLLDFFVLLALW